AASARGRRSSSDACPCSSTVRPQRPIAAAMPSTIGTAPSSTAASHGVNGTSTKRTAGPPQLVPLSGQPSSSSTPLYVSGSLGHLSSTSGTRSRSLSGSGQRSSSSDPLLCPGSGQPSSSSNPSLSSASCGQGSRRSSMPSRSSSPRISSSESGAPPS